ncbi:MAG: dephospho-CoA kinase [Betaproteobacteria bacterium]|nr:dephospho-CoA kinase [Betaproteobacteria bacterium]
MLKSPAIVGLTGGVGCGKSTVATLFANQGISVVDTDVLAHDLTKAGGKAIPAIVGEFGQEVIAANGALDRQAMRDKVFASCEARAKLESILHPLIREGVEICLSANGISTPYAVLVVPLLFETMAYRSRVWRVLAVDCSTTSQVRRVARRPGLDEVDARRIMASQIGRPYRLQLADDLISNEAKQHVLASSVEALHNRYVAMLSARPISHGHD